MGLRRYEEEFYCSKEGGGCGKYFLTYLRTEMHGVYTIECPGCKHHHYRNVDKGQVTSQRNYSLQGKKSEEIIVGLLATLQSNPWMSDKEFLKRRMRVQEQLSMTSPEDYS